MTNQDVVDFVSARVATGLSFTKIAEAMTDFCLARDSMAGIGCDNMTVIIVGFHNASQKEEWAAKIKARMPAIEEVTGGSAL